MNEAKKIIQMIFVANDNSPVIVHPGKQSFDLPTPLVTAKFSAVLRFRLLSIPLMRCNQLNSKRRQFLVERVGIIGFIADQFLRLFSYQSVFNRFSDKLDFMRRSRVRVDGE